MPSGVSIMHMIAISSGAPAAAILASSSRTIAALSTLGSRMASAPLVAMALTSSSPQGVSKPLTRTISSRSP